jgi:hypothetical protein
LQTLFLQQLLGFTTPHYSHNGKNQSTNKNGGFEEMSLVEIN